jgi:outer membrane protein assembly factor BamB
MVVGMTMPNRMVAIDLSTASVVWTQDLAAYGTTYLTGFAPMSPAVHQGNGLVVGSVLINADTTANTTDVLAFALNASTGAVVWAQHLGRGPIPTGFTSPIPLLDNSRVYLNNPVGNNIVALNLLTGTIQWQTGVVTPPGRFSWGPGVLTGGKLIQPVGPTLYTLNASTGSVLNQYAVGGSFTYNHPTVIGKTLYIGNSWGWVTARPLSVVTGGF